MKALPYQFGLARMRFLRSFRQFLVTDKAKSTLKYLFDIMELNPLLQAINWSTLDYLIQVEDGITVLGGKFLKKQ